MIPFSGGQHRLRQLASRFRLWLRRESGAEVGAEVPDEIVAELLALDEPSTATLVSIYPHCGARNTLQTLIDGSYASLGRNPPYAVNLARLAVKLAEASWEPDQGRNDLLVGDCWRQYAGALVSSGEYHEARKACDEAESYYTRLISLEPVLERALLNLVRGQALYYLDSAHEALALIDRSAEELRELNRAKYITARTMQGVVMLGMDRIREAAQVFEEAARLAKQENDTRALCHIVSNIGGCYARLGDITKARRYLAEAIEEFEFLGLKADVLRPQLTLVRLLIQSGKYHTAISTLFSIRQQFLELEMPVLAADTGFWLLDVLFLARRVSQVPSLCAEMIGVFQKAKLPKEAAKALAHFSEAVRQGDIKREDIQHIRDFMIRLEKNPSELFAPPSNLPV
jgi:tetratricopeptide (TPR) repeat protein